MPLHALRAVAIISFQFVIIDQMLAVADGITLRTDLKTGLKQSRGSCSTLRALR